MRNILFVFPRIFNAESEIRYPPFGLLEMASYLKRKGNEAHIFDRNLKDNSLDKLYEIILSGKYDVVGISSMFIQKDDAILILEWVRNNFSGKIALGGDYFIVNKELFLDKVDYVVCGEGELFFEQLCSISLPKGVYYPNNLNNLDEIPIPDSSLLDSVAWDKRVFSLKTSRGCPFACTFCSNLNNRSKNVRTYSAEYIIKYMDYVFEKYGIDQFRFLDDVFLLNRNRVLEFCQLMRQQERHYTIVECFSHISINDQILFDEMARSGFKTVQVGIESANNEVLKLIGKNTTKQQIIETVHAICNSGLKVEGLYMIGNIGDTYQTIMETIYFASCLPTYKDWFSFACPLPNTEFYKKAEQYGVIIENDLNQYTNSKIIFVPTGMNESELLTLMNEAHNMVLKKLRNNAKIKMRSNNKTNI